MAETERNFLANTAPAVPEGGLARLTGAMFRSLRRAETDALPERVRERIARHEDDAEVLLRLFQLAVVVLFGSLYLVSPKTDAATAFAVAPYAIGIYFAVTVAGLVWAVRGHVPDWAVYASIVFDIGLLVVLIWSFHLQYEQPPSFYLKAPTLLYVFIFIALRALRFRARFVLATGLVAAIGWIALFVYAAASGPGGMMVTRDYVAYMTGNFVLIGAEIDKIVSILTVTVVLAIVIRRARGTLVQAVTEEMAARDLSRFFDARVAEQIRGSDRELAAGEGVIRQAAILFVDIRGFSALAETLDPSAATRLIAEYQHRLLPLIQSHGGTIDKFLGDGIMATFGAVADSASYAADALGALDAVIAESRRWRSEAGGDGLSRLTVNASVAAGRIIFAAVGDRTRLEFTVIGAPVNLAAKLDKHNKALSSRAIATAEAFDTARAQGYRPAAAVERITGPVAGIAEPVEMVVVHR